MFIIKRRGKKIGGRHQIYTRSEADDKGIKYTVDWRNASDGDWVLTDDGWVGQLVYTREYIDRRRSRIAGYDVYTRFLFFSFGMTTNRAKTLHLRKHLVNMNRVSAKPWQEAFLKHMRGRLFIVAYCAMMMNEGKVDYYALGMIIAPGKGASYRAKMYLRNPKIKEKLDKAMEELLKKKGITREAVVDDLVKIKDQAIEKGKYKEALDVLGRWEKMLGMDGDITGAKQLPGSDASSEQRKIAERFAEFDNVYDNEFDPDTDEAVKLGKPKKNGIEITDEDGNLLQEVGRGDQD